MDKKIRIIILIINIKIKRTSRIKYLNKIFMKSLFIFEAFCTVFFFHKYLLNNYTFNEGIHFIKSSQSILTLSCKYNIHEFKVATFRCIIFYLELSFSYLICFLSITVKDVILSFN